ncbi:MAG TPA: hypothetical protein VFL51_00250 [Pseudolabrys sp.]|nr:hypothetical protein [Pseudolabrys sp.]
MKNRSRLIAKQWIAAAMFCAGLFGGVAAPAKAADLRLGPGWHSRHVAARYWNWRDRCAYAGYYCLYAEYGFVYAYPFDDRPIAHRRYRRLSR